MKSDPRWQEAQHSEKDFWDGIVRDDAGVRRVLDANSAKAPEVRKHLPANATTGLEIGVGPFGLGVIGFLPEIKSRIALDPLPPVPIVTEPGQSSELRDGILARRAALRYVVGCGEELPVRSDSMDLVICCNVIDHSSNPVAIMLEAYRVLKQSGIFFFDVDTFSVLGLAKWHLWTKRAHKDEILVKAHPHRMREDDLVAKLRACGFSLQILQGHTFASNLIGHARDSTFLGKKCAP